ncbi:MAG: dihydrofolate reductase [Phycisphaerales bacterium]|jgi:dihydrofolate reductase
MEIVVAITENFVIGANGDMPWHLPADLQHFKAITSGSAIVMGRRTWESIGRPLPNRTNIILTRQEDFKAEGATVVHSLDESVEVAKEQKLFVIGGGEIYTQALSRATAMHITRIHTTLKGDTFFPLFDEEEWERSGVIHRNPDNKNCHALTFELWRSKP